MIQTNYFISYGVTTNSSTYNEPDDWWIGFRNMVRTFLLPIKFSVRLHSEIVYNFSSLGVAAKKIKQE